MNNWDDIIKYIDDISPFDNDFTISLSSDDIRKDMMLLAEMCNSENELYDCINRFYETFV